jgi:HNH endonuclease
VIADVPEANTYIPGPRRCIYCWPRKMTTIGLDREHVIAHKLGGKIILHNASCRPCADIINKQIENPALKQTWLSSRTHLGLPTSAPRRTLRIGVFRDNGEPIPQSMANVDFRFEEIPLDAHTFCIFLPVFSPPGILYGKVQTDKFICVGTSSFINNPIPSAPPGWRSAIFEKFDPGVIGRFIAKVAHGAAVAALGTGAFDPFLPDIILGESPFISHYVGSSLRRGRKRQELHKIILNIRGGFLVANVQLFSKFGLQSFDAVVGRPVGELARLHLTTAAKAQ